MGPVVINGCIHTAGKQHQMKNVPNCVCIASRVLRELGLFGPLVFVFSTKWEPFSRLGSESVHPTSLILDPHRQQKVVLLIACVGTFRFVFQLLPCKYGNRASIHGRLGARDWMGVWEIPKFFDWYSCPRLILKCFVAVPLNCAVFRQMQSLSGRLRNSYILWL